MKPAACPHCGTVNQVPSPYLGRNVKCSGCSKDFKAVELLVAPQQPTVVAQAQPLVVVSNDGPISLWKKSPGCMVLVILLAIAIGMVLFFVFAGAAIWGSK